MIPSHDLSGESYLLRGLRLLLVCAVATVVTACSLHATPVAGEDRQTLDGVWFFTIEENKLSQPASEWDRLPVPGNWDTTNRYAHHVGKGWYRRSFTVPASWEGRRLRLQFDAVYETAEVFLNGERLGLHEGGYTPFDFDVTSRVFRDRPNTLTVCADSTFRRGAWWAWGGISRSVALTAYRDVRIVRQKVRAEPDLASGSARVFWEVLVENAGQTAADVEVQGNAAFGETSVGTWSGSARVPAGGTAMVSGELDLRPESVHLWHVEHPHLYHALSRLRSGGVVQHEKRDRFGIRQVRIRPDGLYLNGERVRMVGFNRIHDHRAYGNTEPEHLIRLDVDLMKRYGAHFMRLMHAPTSPNLLDYLDEKGIMIFAEIPVWGGDDPNVIPDNPRTRGWLKEMIERDYNHPCIIGWSPGNELLKHDAYVKSMIDYARTELDPHRLHAYVSFSGGRDDYGPANDPISVSDLILYNTYSPDPGRLVDILQKKWPGRPIFLSEYGSRQFGEEVTARIPGLDERWDTLAGRPEVIGTALWTFNDYRSSYRNSEPGELRSWGIVDLWRQPKEGARDIARLHSPIRRLRISGETARILPRGTDEFPAFALRGYHLVWEWRNREGLALGGGAARLPDLMPGSPEQMIPLTGKPAAFDALVVTLVSPTGYGVHESSTRDTASLSPLARPTAQSAPSINHVYPLDGGFMVGYSTQPDDSAFTIAYGTSPGVFATTATVALKGALAVSGLENGRRYHARLRREPAGRAPGDWSPEFTVVPDGGIAPPAPTLTAVVRGRGIIALRFAGIPKATSYRLRWGPGANEVRWIQAAAPGPVILSGFDDHRAYPFSVTALRGDIESTGSATVTAPPWIQ
jgi:beta-galactosidase